MYLLNEISLKKDISSHSICFSMTDWYANILWNVMQVQFQSHAEMCIKLEAFFVFSVMFSVTAQACFYWCSSCESQWGVSARKKTSSEKHIFDGLVPYGICADAQHDHKE